MMAKIEQIFGIHFDVNTSPKVVKKKLKAAS